MKNLNQLFEEVLKEAKGFGLCPLCGKEADLSLYCNLAS